VHTLRDTTDVINLPRFDVAALLHEGPDSEPQTVYDGEVVSYRRTVIVILDVPLVRTEPANEEQHDANADVGEQNAHPYFVGEWIHEREHTRRLFDWFL